MRVGEVLVGKLLVINDSVMSEKVLVMSRIKYIGDRGFAVLIFCTIGHFFDHLFALKKALEVWD